MLYTPLKTNIEPGQRNTLNQKCFNIADGITSNINYSKEEIYQYFTGKGGLHDLSRGDYQNYAHYSHDKKIKEMGQFFTPDHIIEEIVSYLDIDQYDLICDPTCGKGSFLNYLPYQSNVYGNELDYQTFKVAEYLFDQANITNQDIGYYNPGLKFNYILGNPPFNLQIYFEGEKIYTQNAFFKKSSQLLKPGGIIIAVVPKSFLNDPTANSSLMYFINNDFGFIGQQEIPTNSFKASGVNAFPMKIIAFQKSIENVSMPGYENIYCDNLENELKNAQTRSNNNLLAINRMVNQTGNDFKDKISKYIYEIKAHPILRPLIKKALRKIDQFKTQKKPHEMSEKEWESKKLTENKVISYLKRIVSSQEIRLNPPKQDNVIKLVKWNYGLKLKAYSGKAKRRLDKLTTPKLLDWSEIVNNPQLIKKIQNAADTNSENIAKVANKKYQEALLINTSFDKVIVDNNLRIHLENYTAKDKKGNVIKLKAIQKIDLGLALKKKYCLLNWQQGSGKSVAGVCWMRYVKNLNRVKYTFIVGPSIATKMTWDRLLRVNNENYIFVEKPSDIFNAKKGTIFLISLTMVKKYERELQKFVRLNSHKVSLLFDESDEISNVHSQQSLAMKKIFRKAKYKLLTTGTATRNNITELYPQLELMYNNSQNLLSFSKNVYHQEKIKKIVLSTNGSAKLQETGEVKITSSANKYYGKPFPAYSGHSHFKSCFNPSKTSVFGIKKQNQDLYNIEELKRITGISILTRSFKDIIGSDKYKITYHKIAMDNQEIDLYNILLKNFFQIVDQYFKSTGNSRKDAALRIVRQMQLLILACSIPQSFSQWKGGQESSKMKVILQDVKQTKAPVIIGTTSKQAVEKYANMLRYHFPFRQVYEITGEISFKKREKIIAAFSSYHDAIIVCTQKSLSSSVDIPTCDNVFCESLQWNFPRMEQFYFRAIRLNSKNKTNVRFYAYQNSIEQNIMGLLLTKEKINEFVKTREESNMDSLLSEYGVDNSLFEQLLSKRIDSEGVLQLEWGSQKIVS